MHVSLMLTCLCDALYGEVGIACVKVLEHAGCTVDFDDRQTCCGQPPFNAGDWAAARQIASHALEVFPPSIQYLVTPSTSCAAMFREGYPMLFPDRGMPYCYELAEFLVEVLGIEKWPLSGNVITRKRRIVFHRACHHRALSHTSRSASCSESSHQERLLAMVPGVEIVSFAHSDQCCGFGGAFSATHGSISSGIGLEKLKNIVDSGVEEIVSSDMGCLMHLNGLIERHELKLRTRHYSELMAEAL